MEMIVNPNSNPNTEAWEVTTLLATPSSSIKIEGKKTGVVTKAPVLIGKTQVQIYIDALADLQEPALEITNTKHDLQLEHCEFIQEEDAKNGKLLMSGYIRVNVDYTTPNILDDGTVGIENKRTGMNIPFKCFTKLRLDSEPVFTSAAKTAKSEDGAAYNSSLNSFYYLNTDDQLNFEVAETRIRQVNIKRNIENMSINNYNEQIFSSFTVNMAVEVTLLILQDQYIQISSSDKSGSGDSKGSSDSKGDKNSSDKGDKNSSCQGGKNSKDGDKNSKDGDKNSKDGDKNSKEKKDEGNKTNKECQKNDLHFNLFCSLKKHQLWKRMF
ncbi:MAG: hypothetical protein Q8920_03095 [Bacillota bacterium]|nr:hypothetical protein [Bacillota bacterium]